MTVCLWTRPTAKTLWSPSFSQHPAVGRQDSSPWPVTMALLTLHGMGTVLGAQ